MTNNKKGRPTRRQAPRASYLDKRAVDMATAQLCVVLIATYICTCFAVERYVNIFLW